jgi:hypothetical protein
MSTLVGLHITFFDLRGIVLKLRGFFASVRGFLLLDPNQQKTVDIGADNATK